MVPPPKPDEIFSFKTKADFLRKLTWELEQFRNNPECPFVALNFFVTADSMVDWENPGADRPTLRTVRDSNALHLVAEHLAVLAKHSLDISSNHKSISAAALVHRSFFGGAFFRGGFFDKGELWVKFGGQAASDLGVAEMRAIALAEKVYVHWEARR